MQPMLSLVGGSNEPHTLRKMRTHARPAKGRSETVQHKMARMKDLHSTESVQFKMARMKDQHSTETA